MYRFSRPLLIFLALLMALPLQAYAFYAASQCPMAMEHMGGAMPQTDCEGCESATGCGLMNLCQNMQPGVLTVSIGSSALSLSASSFATLSPAYQSRSLAPPHEPPRTL